MLAHHETVRHSVGKYVEEQAHTNGIESFWALLKRGYYGTYHKMSEKHLARHIGEFAERHNARAADTIQQMAIMAQGMMGKRLQYQELHRRSINQEGPTGKMVGPSSFLTGKTYC